MPIETKESESLLLTAEQTAQKLAISLPSLFNLKRRGVIPYYQLGVILRFDLKKVLAALAAYEKPANPEPAKFPNLKGRHTAKAARGYHGHLLPKAASETAAATKEEAI
jgi:hypothetical protein